MALSKQEIIDYASRYVTDDQITDFPHDGDLFCLLGRLLPTDKVLTDEEGWGFQGYGICLGYALDEDAKPSGKWVWFHFASLSAFPPPQQVFKLQPPHVVKGRFQNPERTHEFRIVKVGLNAPGDAAGAIGALPRNSGDKPAGKTTENGSEPAKGKIVKFRQKKDGKPVA